MYQQQSKCNGKSTLVGFLQKRIQLKLSVEILQSGKLPIYFEGCKCNFYHNNLNISELFYLGIRHVAKIITKILRGIQKCDNT